MLKSTLYDTCPSGAIPKPSKDAIVSEELARISPLAFAHVIPNGTYFTQRIQRERTGEPNGHVHPLEVEMASDL